MRYIVDSNNYVTAISFGNTMEYNDCVCVEYTGAVPSRWNSLEAWYLDEGNKLWRWQIIDGELVMDESAVAPEEESWMGITAREPVFAINADYDAADLTFYLPDGTKKLAGFIILPNIEGFMSTDPHDKREYCVSLHSSVKENTTDLVCVGIHVDGQRYFVERKSVENAFELGEDYVKVTIGVYNDYLISYFAVGVEYALYPLYRK